MSKLIQHLALTALIALGIAADSTHGAPITQPSGLTPGAEYRLAFLTSTTRDATSSNIADYNTFVTNAANAVPELAALNTTWKAIASTAAVDARDNSDTRPSSVSGGILGVRIFLLNDTLLTNSNDALWNTLQFAFHTLLNINENGDAVVGDQKPWTGTSTIGTENGVFRPLGYASTPFSGVGSNTRSDGPWIANGSATQTESHPLYAISGILTIPALTGDLDGDGFVGIADLNIVLGNWNQTVPPGDPSADTDNDGFVGIADLNEVLGNWNAGTPPVSHAGLTAPEPAGVALLTACCLGIVHRRRRVNSVLRMIRFAR